ncbi:MAG: response regulator FixJ [Acidocella sp.]|nr:response regulator FixJ [Acidocella sp.]
MKYNAVVHLVDDDDGVRQALAFLLTSSGFAVRVYESASAFLEAIPTLQPGCIVTDVRMPGISGLELQRQLKARQISLPVIVMTGHGDVALAVEAMKAGAVDFIEKPFADETMISSIRVALDRHARDAGRDIEMAAISAKLRTLTARETEVLEGLVAGLPNKTIAYDLNISARTVEVHRANVMTKMAAANLPELVRMVLLLRSGVSGS